MAPIADDPLQRDLDDAAMGDHQDVTLLVATEDFIDGGAHTRLKRVCAFATRHDVPVRLFDPPRPRAGKSLGDLFSPQTLPFTQKDLPQRFFRIRLSAYRRGDGLRGFEGSLQVTGVEARETAAREAPAQPVCLAPPLIRERGVQLSLDAALSVPGRLSVANEQESRRRRSGRNGDGVVWLGG